MTLAVVLAAVVFAGGLLLAFAAVRPAPPSLASALRQLHAPHRPLRQPLVDPAAPADRPRSVAVGLGRRIGSRAGLGDERTLGDLAIVGRAPELHAGITVLAVVGGALAGPAIWALAVLAGFDLPAAVPLWSLAVGGVVGWAIPRVALRAEAAAARRDFRHALGAYLDVLVLLLAAQEGPESAMELAAQAGSGPAFDELCTATRQARLSGEPVWTRLDEAGRRLGVPELSEIAAAGSLAGESGAAVRRSLTAKARAMRSAALAAAEAAARRQSQAMFAPLVLMGLGFIVFLIYPLVTNLAVGGP